MFEANSAYCSACCSGVHAWRCKVDDLVLGTGSVPAVENGNARETINRGEKKILIIKIKIIIITIGARIVINITKRTRTHMTY